MFFEKTSVSPTTFEGEGLSPPPPPDEKHPTIITLLPLRRPQVLLFLATCTGFVVCEFGLSRYALLVIVCPCELVCSLKFFLSFYVGGVFRCSYLYTFPWIFAFLTVFTFSYLLRIGYTLLFRLSMSCDICKPVIQTNPTIAYSQLFNCINSNSLTKLLNNLPTIDHNFVS